MRTSTRFAIIVASAAVGLAACTSDDGDAADSTASTSTASTSTAAPVEESKATPRLALTYDGGIRVLDATTLKEIADIPLDGFNRLNPAGNGRHAMVSTSKGFELLDLGSWSEAHGDHAHHYSTTPGLTGQVWEGSKPGHVVVHDGRTVLFADGDGGVKILDPKRIGEDDAVLETVKLPAHHGVAVARADDSLVVTRGTEETRSGIEVRDGAGKVVVKNDECPGIHGEAAAADGVLAFGCEDGVLLLKGNTITKVKAQQSYARIGNQRGSDESPIVLGDYKTEKDNEHEHPRKFSLIDSAAGTIRVVDFPASYSFRSLARGPKGEAILLGTDGILHIYDPVTAAETAAYPVIDKWTEPEEWQTAMPNVLVQDSVAYVSDPATKKLIAVDLATGAKRTEVTLDVAAVELTGNEG